MYTFYVDGSYRQRQNTGGYACYCIEQDTLIYGNAENTTNNRMEIYSTLLAIQSIPDGHEVTIYSDSAYVVNTIAKRWIIGWSYNNWRTGSNQPVKNKDLWEIILCHLGRVKVNMIWVKAHNGNPYNELCDSVAQYMSSTVR